MFNQVLHVEKLANDLKEGIDKKILMENNQSSLNIVRLKENEIIEKHTSEVNVGVYLISGKIELHFDTEQFLLKKGNLFLFEKNLQHKVIAKEDSLFFVIRI